MARWIKITEDSGATLVIDLDKVVAILHDPNQDIKRDKYIVYLPGGQLEFTRRDNPEGYQVMAQHMKILEALSE